MTVTPLENNPGNPRETVTTDGSLLAQPLGKKAVSGSEFDKTDKTDEGLPSTLEKSHAIIRAQQALIEQLRNDNHRLTIENKGSETDGDTGLLNRKGLRKEVAQLSRELPPEQFVGILEIDVDDFARYNEYGHHTGDDIAKLAADVVRRNIRGESDLAARWGGDEFLIVMTLTGEAAFDEAAAQSAMREIIETRMDEITKQVCDELLQELDPSKYRFLAALDEATLIELVGKFTVTAGSSIARAKDIRSNEDLDTAIMHADNDERARKDAKKAKQTEQDTAAK